MELREVTPEDDDAVAGWFDDAAAVRRFAGPTLDWPLTPQQLRAVRADTHAWTAWSDGRRAGRGELVDIGDGGLRLARFAVAPGERGRGLGTALLRALLDEARKLGAARVELNVLADNDIAQRLYHSAGFGSLEAAGGVIRMARAV